MRSSILLICVLGARLSGAADFDHTHALLGKVLARYVSNGLVDYAGLKADRKNLDHYLDASGSVKEVDFKKWEQPRQLAFLINLYNASALKLIIEHYPVKSIKKIGGWFGRPWDVEVAPYFGNIATLGYLEHEVIRKNYNEPRIHFALVCAALGCPELRREPYMDGRLNDQLEEQGRLFLRDKKKNHLNLKTGILYLSPIFKWFAEDFEQKSGSVLNFVRRYFTEEEQKYLAQGQTKIRYSEYDWALNEQSR